MEFGYRDQRIVPQERISWPLKLVLVTIGLAIIVLFWWVLTQKLVLGQDWISPTYDNIDWRTNEGNLRTFGAWDLETHIWKAEFMAENFPHFQWNPYWYLGMPMFKYYQMGFYFVTWGFSIVAGVTMARSATLLVVFGHLLAALLTFLLCYKISRRIIVSALCATFVISNPFLSLRSYGWEPITVLFFFLYPLGLLIFLREPLRPFRFWMIFILGMAYISHPLIWFSLCMFMGLYLLSIALRTYKKKLSTPPHHALLQFFLVVPVSLLLGGLQFIPQITYEQATSGAHMGVKYLPFYQVPFNIISIQDFLFDAGNLKGPGPIIIIAMILAVLFSFWGYRSWKRAGGRRGRRRVFPWDHELITGTALALLFMIAFYYMEAYNIFPMNILRSTQYHRIIPEFLVTAAMLVAALSVLLRTKMQQVIYYSLLASFVLASGIIVLNVQAKWETTAVIDDQPEFIYEEFPGRMSFPYTDQSLSVRNSFTNQPQVYGYYEQGITNPYADEMFSVSSGFHNLNLTTLYLKAGHVGRLYINTEEGARDKITFARLNGSFPFIHNGTSRYGYFNLTLPHPSMAQAVDRNLAEEVNEHEMGCRILFMEEYCGSAREEFVGTDLAEIQYLQNYVQLLEKPYGAQAEMRMMNPDTYTINVTNATANTAIVVKMSYSPDFIARIGSQQVDIKPIGPYFMLLSPNKKGSYTLRLAYETSRAVGVGMIISVVSLITLLLYFIIRPRMEKPSWLQFPKGDMK